MQKMSLKFLPLILFVVFTAWIITSKKPDSVTSPISKEDKITITASFYPLYFFSKEITGDRAEVINLTKAGSEPHDFEPSTKDIRNIENSKLLIVNGNTFESWLPQFGEQISQENTQILKVGESPDPHLWLDPVLAQNQVEMINAKLQEIDPTNATFYQTNSKMLIQKLAELDSEFRTGLSKCEKNKIITSHGAFAYLAQRYNLRQVSIQGLNPDGDPSPAKIAETAKLAKENGINYIFFETLVSPKIAETIAKEIGAKTLVLNPIEGLNETEEQNGQDYFSIQRSNLANLRLALNCQ